MFGRASTVETYATQLGRLVAAFEPCGAIVTATGVDQAGLHLAMAFEDRFAALYSLPELVSGSTLEDALELRLETSAVVVGFAIDGTYLSTSGHGWLRVWDIPTGTLVVQPRVEIDTPPFTAFSPDGKSLFYADDGYEVRKLILEPADLVEHATQRLTRELTREECLMYLGPKRCDAGEA